MVTVTSEYFLLFSQIISLTFDIGYTNYVKQLHRLYFLSILKFSSLISFDMLLVTELQLVENPEITVLPFQRKLFSHCQIYYKS